MDGIIENIQFLIPLALFIAFRVFRSKNEQAKKQQKKSFDQSKADLVAKIKEAQRIPEHRKSLTKETSIYIPLQPSPQSKASAKQKPAVIHPPVQAKTQKNLLSETKTHINPAFASLAATDQSPAATAPAAKTGFPLQGLNSLQQAVVWAEILGQPKGISLGDIS